MRFGGPFALAGGPPRNEAIMSCRGLPPAVLGGGRSKYNDPIPPSAYRDGEIAFGRQTGKRTSR